jgi:hypothetical protein
MAFLLQLISLLPTIIRVISEIISLVKLLPHDEKPMAMTTLKSAKTALDLGQARFDISQRIKPL